MNLRTAVTLLPTPTARDWKSGASNLMGTNARPLNETVVNLLPTPKASDGTHGGPNQRDSSGRYALPGMAVRLDGQWIATNGTDYGPAIRRWEAVMGREAPCPTEPGTRGNRRLSPVFEEWMMGLPDGWVTAVPDIPRKEQMRMLGNGVVWQQGLHAFTMLMNDEYDLEREDMTEEVKQEKTEPERFPCTGCKFSYVLVKADRKDAEPTVIRNHNSRTGPGRCEGSGKAPRADHTGGCTEEARFGPSVCSGCPQPELPSEQVIREETMAVLEDAFTAPVPVVHCLPGKCVGCCGCSSMCTDTPCVGAREIAISSPAPAVYADPNASRYEQDDNPGAVDAFTAPAPMPAELPPVSGQPEPDRDRWGRYMITGTAHTRVTTFVKSASSTFSLNQWQQRMVIAGLVQRRDLLALAHGLDVKRDRSTLNSIAEQAKEAAGQKVAANLGTAYHAFSERLDAGLISLQDIPPEYQERLAQYSDTLSRSGLVTRPEWIERTTAVRADQVSAGLPVAGTLDRIFQLPNGELVIGDLKTGADLSYGWGEIAAQLAIYAHGVNTHGLFDWNTKEWERMHAPGGLIRTDFAIVIHLPADGEGCTLYRVDIAKGWERAQVCGHVMAMQKSKDSLAHPISVLETDPSAPVAPQPARFVDTGDPYALALHLISQAPTRERIAELYQFAADSGKFTGHGLADLVTAGMARVADLG